MHQDASEALWMDERDPGPTGSRPADRVDQRVARASERRERRVDVAHLQRDVMKPGAAAADVIDAPDAAGRRPRETNRVRQIDPDTERRIGWEEYAVGPCQTYCWFEIRDGNACVAEEVEELKRKRPDTRHLQRDVMY